MCGIPPREGAVDAYRFDVAKTCVGSFLIIQDLMHAFKRTDANHKADQSCARKAKDAAKNEPRRETSMRMAERDGQMRVFTIGSELFSVSLKI